MVTLTINISEEFEDVAEDIRDQIEKYAAILLAEKVIDKMEAKILENLMKDGYRGFKFYKLYGKDSKPYYNAHRLIKKKKTIALYIGRTLKRAIKKIDKKILELGIK